MNYEDEQLLPRYAASAPKGRSQGAPEHFRAEHEKIRSMLGTIVEDIRNLRAGPTVNREVLTLLERENRLKGLMEHHTLREEKYLFPSIEATS